MANPAALSTAPRPRFFYGWVIVGVCFLAQFAGTIAGAYGLTVMLVPMSEELGWSRTAIVGANIPASITAALVSPFLGRISEKYGSRYPLALSAVIGGVSTMAIAGVHSLWVYYLVFGLVNGVTRPMVQVIGVSAGVAEWFTKKRSTAAGMISLGIPVSGLMGIPIAQYMVIHFGWRSTWFALGAMAILLVGIPAAIFWRTRPEDIGLLPDGEVAQPIEDASTGTSGAAVMAATPVANGRWGLYRETEDWDAREATRTRTFWVLTLLLPIIALTGPAFMTHIVAFFLSKGLSPEGAAAASTIFVVGTFVARFFWVWLSDRVHIQYCYVLLGVIATLSTGAITFAPSLNWSYFATGMFGVAAGGMLQLRLQIWPDYFGRRPIARLRGYAAPFELIGGVSGPFFAAWVYDQTQSYDQALLAFTILSGVSTLGMLLVGGPPKRRGAPADTA